MARRAAAALLPPRAFRRTDMAEIVAAFLRPAAAILVPMLGRNSRRADLVFPGSVWELGGRRQGTASHGFLASQSGRGEVELCQGRDLRAQLLSQCAGSYLLDLPRGEIAQPERPEGDPDQPIDGEAEMTKHVLHLAILAFPDRECQPDVVALYAVCRGFNRPIADAVNGNAALQRIELLLRHAAVGAHAIAAQPARRRKFKHARKRAVIGQKEEPFRVEIEPSHTDEPRQALGQDVEYCGAPPRIAMRGESSAWLVKEEEPRALARRQHPAVDGYLVLRAHGHRRRGDHFPVHRHAGRGDPAFRLAPRREPRPRDDFRNAVALPA